MKNLFLPQVHVWLSIVGLGVLFSTPGSSQQTSTAAPEFSLASGAYSGSQTVTITDATPGATIYYTTNGALPTTSSTLYAGAITVSTSETLAAIATAPGYSTSAVAGALYSIGSSPTDLIYTIAGNGIAGYSGDGGQATTAQLNSASGTARDSAGNLYIADTQNNRIRKVAAGTGVITTIAGTGIAGYSGDGGAAEDAELNLPLGVAFDSAGNLYIADEENHVVRKIASTTGVITTVAGNGVYGYSGDNGPAISAELYYPSGIAIDGSGNLFIADGSDRIREVAAGTAIISTVAGNGQQGCSGDGGAATKAEISNPPGIAVDGAGNLFIADTYCEVVRKVSASNGEITTVAGVNGGLFVNGGYSGDGGPATSAKLNYPYGVAVNGAGNLYIDDWLNYVVRKVAYGTGIISTVVGNQVNGCNEESMYSGDGGLAISAAICLPTGISVDSIGDLYIAGGSQLLIDEAYDVLPSAQTAAPVLSVSAGTYSSPQTVTIADATPGAAIHITMDGTTPTGASPDYSGPIDVTGTVTMEAIAIAPGKLESPVVSTAYTITSRPVTVIETLAGNGVSGFSGAGGAATSAVLGSPAALAVDGSGNRYIADSRDNVVWKISANTGTISIVAGTGKTGYTGDGGAATSATLNLPRGLAVDSVDNIYIADTGNQVIRRVDANTGTISTVAGNGTQAPGGGGIRGDGGPATAAELSDPWGVALDKAGNFYIADYFDQAIRMVSATTGIINTVAGTGQYGQAGEGGLATTAQLEYPDGITVDSTGNLYIADEGRVSKVTASTGILAKVAGTGNPGYSGDGGAATSAEIEPYSVAVEGAGNIYLGTYFGVREVPASTGVITTVAGNRTWLYSGDGGSATMAGMCAAAGIALDADGDLYIADNCGYRVREVILPGAPTVTVTPGSSSITTAQALTVTVAIHGPSGNPTPTGSVTLNGGGYTSAATNLSDGSATISIPAGSLAKGSDTLTASYTSDSASSSIYNSATGTASVTVTQAVQTPAPTFNPPPGTYATNLSVTISDSTSGAAIYYTTNGAIPTASSTKYTAPIAVSASDTIEAIAVAPGDSNSSIASAIYIIQPATGSGLRFVPVAPCRIADTRNLAGPFGGPELTAESVRTFDIPQSACDIPTTALAYSLNVTVVPNASLNYLTLWPAGQTQPLVSTLNSDGRIKANAAITPAGTNGGVSVYVSNATHVILDIDGYFVPASTASALAFYPLTPCRVADTRGAAGTLGGPSISGGASRAFPVQSSTCNIPATAQAYSLNVTAVPHKTLNYLTAWNTGGAQPNVSTLNSSTGAVAANAAIVPAGNGGDISIYVSDAADVILDVNGYFAPPATGGLSLYAVPPCRVVDTRSGAGAFKGVFAVDAATSSCAPPATAQAYVLNATVVPPGPLNYLTLWPNGEAQPVVSTLNAEDGAITSNMAIVPTLNGSVNAYSSDSTNLILDISSYFAP